MLHVRPFHSSPFADAVRFDPLNSIHTRQSSLNSCGNSTDGCRNWSRSLIHVGLIRRRTVNMTAAFSKLSGFTKNAPAVQ